MNFQSLLGLSFAFPWRSDALSQPHRSLSLCKYPQGAPTLIAGGKGRWKLIIISRTQEKAERWSSVEGREGGILAAGEQLEIAAPGFYLPWDRGALAKPRKHLGCSWWNFTRALLWQINDVTTQAWARGESWGCFISSLLFFPPSLSVLFLVFSFIPSFFPSFFIFLSAARAATKEFLDEPFPEFWFISLSLFTPWWKSSWDPLGEESLSQTNSFGYSWESWTKIFLLLQRS